MASIIDGTSNTRWCSEVHAWGAYTRNAGPSTTTMPETVSEIAAIADSGLKDRLNPDKTGTARTEWTNGHGHHSCFTVTMPPNTRVPYTFNGIKYDVDYNSQAEGSSISRASYAVLTSRSWHTSGVNSCLIDGSVHFFNSSIDKQVWSSFGTRDGSEVAAIP